MKDPRLTPANGRVAAVELKGHIPSASYVQGEARRVITPVADLHCRTDASQLDRQLLQGDRFRVLENKDGRAFGQADRGGHVGYVTTDALGPWQAPTHWVSARASLAFSAPDFKAPDPVALSHGCREHVIDQIGRFSETSDGTFIPTAHLRAMTDPAQDPVTEVEQLIGAPYLWGGNSSAGLDCSGLVQGALIACGIACPGDSDQQQAELGECLPGDARLQRGDLLFWKGHVAWVVNPDTLIHANAFHMAVTYEPIHDAINRIEAQRDGPVIARKRLKGLS